MLRAGNEGKWKEMEKREMTKSYGVGVKKVNSDVLFDTGPPSVEQRPCRWCDQRSRGTKKATGW